MLRHIRVLIPGVVVALGLAQLSAAPPPPAKDDAGWKTLFDGKSLDGWKSADYFGTGKVLVKDRTLVLERGKKMTGATYARTDFPKMDYEVSLEAQKTAGNDFFATTTFPVGEAFCSLVVGGWGGGVVGLSSLDSADASENATRKDMTFKAGQWYRVRIRVSKNRIESWIDKEKVVDVDTTDRRILDPSGVCRLQAVRHRHLRKCRPGPRHPRPRADRRGQEGHRGNEAGKEGVGSRLGAQRLIERLEREGPPERTRKLLTAALLLTGLGPAKQ